MNEFDKIFNKFFTRLKVEGLLRSLILGSIIGFSLSILTAIVLFFVGQGGIWIAIVIGLLGLIITSILAYFKHYRPTREDVARRVDMEGLEERVITMISQEDNDSFMARMQREDTKAKINEIKDTKLQLVLSKKLCISALSVLVVAIIVVSLVGVSLSGALPSFNDIVNKPVIQDCTINYMGSTGGFVSGDTKQVVKEGNKTKEVVAVAKNGYMFSIWSDGVMTPARREENVSRSFDVVAIFEKIDENSDSGFREDKDAPDVNVDMDKIEGQMPDHMEGATGKYEEYNQVIDGETYYRDVLKEYYDKAQEILNAGGVVPEYIRVIIDEYYKVIK